MVSDTRCHTKKVIGCAIFTEMKSFLLFLKCMGSLFFFICGTTVESIHHSSCWENEVGEVSSL